MNEHGRAAQCYREARIFQLDHSNECRVLNRLGFAFKRQGRWKDAIAVWEEMVDKRIDIEIAYEELAKYYEHRKRDVSKAMTFVDKALERIQLQEELNQIGSGSAVKMQFEFRKSRLERKRHQIQG